MSVIGRRIGVHRAMALAWAIVLAWPSMAAAQPVSATPAAPPGMAPLAAALPHDLSPWGMFLAADWVVKAVMAGLALASVLTWTVWLAKGLELSAAKRQARDALAVLAAARTLAEASGRLESRRDAASALARAAAQELHLSADTRKPDGIKERIAWRLQRIEAQAARSMAAGTGVLATIGATAPFVGLFGTVWGIMNSFIGISRAQTTNLAVVAPGIAEALLATAIGLVAAIPAVVVYNVFARTIAGYKGFLSDASAEIMGLVSRDLDRAEVRTRNAAE